MDPNKVSRDGLYPIAAEDRDRLPTGAGTPGEVRARWNGEPRRAPRRGEWFLSGGIVEAYYAPHDTTIEYHIAVLVKPEATVTRWVEV